VSRDLAHDRDDRKPRRRVPFILLLLFLALLPTANAQRTDLERIKSDILRLRGKLEEVRRQARSAERELQEVDLELGIHTHELELATAAEEKLAAEQKGIEEQIAALVPRIAQQKADLGKRVVVLYRLGSLSYVRMLLSIESDRNPLAAISMLSYLVSRDARLVSTFQATQQQLAVQTAQLADRRDKLHRTRLVVEERRRAVAASYAQKATLLAKLRTSETGTAQQLAALEEKARRLQRLVTSLAQQTPSVASAVDIRSVQGALEWPVRGVVIEEFGRQRNPKFATYTVNNGLKIEANAGTDVRAVFQGTVLFSQWFKGYGNLIILDHGNRIFSLYGNVKATSVAVGDRITTGQPIAQVGESEETSSGHLYFEIRHDNHPEDPRSWLR
jgi:septal ring factor EnvC (AmiA/AmiB activator)